MMPQVAAAAAVTVSRLVQLPVMAQPFKNIPRTIQANNFWLFIRSPPFQLYQAQLQHLLDSETTWQPKKFCEIRKTLSCCLAYPFTHQRQAPL